MDLYSHWIDPVKITLNGSEEGFEPEDWRAHLEGRMANAFDLSRRITECLRELSLADKFGSNEIEEARVAAEMAIASLRDLTGIGITPGPNGQSLLARLLSSLGKDVSKLQLVTPGDVQKLYGTNEAWRQLLLDAVPALANLRIVKATGETGLTPADTVAELDQLLQLVFDPANLWAIVKQQWIALDLKTKLGLKDVEFRNMADLVNPEEPKDPNVPARMDLRRQLAYENLGVFWRSFVKSSLVNDNGEPITNQSFACFLRAYCLLRFGKKLSQLVPGSGAPGDLNCVGAKAVMDQTQLETNYAALRVSPIWPPPDKDWPRADKDKPALERFFPKLLSSIKVWTNLFDYRLEISNPDPKAKVQKTNTPYSVTLPIDTLEAEPNDDDILSSISGVGILMQDLAEPGWRCLNMAAPQTSKPKPGSPDKRDVVPLGLTALVPLRLNYRNELRQAHISYNNQPLATLSPTAQMNTHQPYTNNSADAKAGAPKDPVPLLSYSYSEAEIAKLCGLKFGRTYECLPFIIGNCGVLPRELAAGEDSPCKIKLSGLPRSPLLEKKIRKFVYKRSVPIGQVRVYAPDGNSCVQIPKIPDNVYPRARDMIIDPVQPNHNGSALTPSKKNQADVVAVAGEPKRPLILLAPGTVGWRDSKTDFSFAIRLPSTDIHTWDRWVAGTVDSKSTDTEKKAKKDLRITTWAEYYRKLDPDQKPTTECVSYSLTDDATLDDPALAFSFWVELYREKGNAQPELVRDGKSKIKITRPPPPAVCPTTKLGETCMAPVQSPAVVLKVRTPKASDPIAEGILSSNEIIVAEGNVYRLKMFCGLPKTDQAKFADIWEEPLVEVDSHYMVSPYEMLIEVATSSLGIEPALDELKINGPDQTNSDVPLTVSLANADGAGFTHVHRVELQRQMWRWLGREMSKHPCLDGVDDMNGGGDKFIKWEAKEFGSRSDYDYLAVSMRPVLDEKKGDGSRTFEYQEKLSGPDVKEDLRAHHYRFRARAISRYEGMLEKSEAQSSRWQSRFVPCRVREKIQPPNVKLILPLTESFGAAGGSKTAGLLVVLGEPWYQVGGIGETIGVEVVGVDKPVHYLELGSDPILSASGEPPNEVAKFTKIRGPIGHTFDRTLEAALFTSTSFIIPAPKINDAETDFSWKFCKLRLRREIPKMKATPLFSEFTDPFWVQYLPEFFLEDVGGTKFGNLLLRWENDNELSLVDRISGNPIVVKVTPGGKAVFDSYLVLTRRVFDATGRFNEEEYLGLYYRRDSKWVKAKVSGSPQVKDSDRLLARIIEVQRRVGSSGFTDEDQLWAAIFNQSGPDGVRARIVRISEPIPSQAALTQPC